MPGRLYRLRRSDTDGFPAEFFGSEWTDWRPLLYPERSGVWYARANLRAPPESGVYEISLVNLDSHRRHVVYLGSTKNLRRRMWSYAWRGSHLSPLLKQSLDQGDRVDVRWFVSRMHETAEMLALKRFEYRFNLALQDKNQVQ